MRQGPLARHAEVSPDLDHHDFARQAADLLDKVVILDGAQLDFGIGGRHVRGGRRQYEQSRTKEKVSGPAHHCLRFSGTGNRRSSGRPSHHRNREARPLPGQRGPSPRYSGKRGWGEGASALTAESPSPPAPLPRVQGRNALRFSLGSFVDAWQNHNGFTSRGRSCVTSSTVTTCCTPRGTWPARWDRTAWRRPARRCSVASPPW